MQMKDQNQRSGPESIPHRSHAEFSPDQHKIKNNKIEILCNKAMTTLAYVSGPEEEKKWFAGGGKKKTLNNGWQ